MNGSIPAILTGGFGNGTFAGSPSLVVTMGYGIGEPPAGPAVIYLCLAAAYRENSIRAEYHRNIIAVTSSGCRC